VKLSLAHNFKSLDLFGLVTMLGGIELVVQSRDFLQKDRYVVLLHSFVAK